MKKEVEILWNGTVHYRRLEGDPDVTEMAELIKKGTPSIRHGQVRCHKEALNKKRNRQ